MSTYSVELCTTTQSLNDSFRMQSSFETLSTFLEKAENQIYKEQLCLFSFPFYFSSKIFQSFLFGSTLDEQVKGMGPD